MLGNWLTKTIISSLMTLLLIFGFHYVYINTSVTKPSFLQRDFFSDLYFTWSLTVKNFKRLFGLQSNLERYVESLNHSALPSFNFTNVNINETRKNEIDSMIENMYNTLRTQNSSFNTLYNDFAGSYGIDVSKPWSMNMYIVDTYNQTTQAISVFSLTWNGSMFLVNMSEPLKPINVIFVDYQLFNEALTQLEQQKFYSFGLVWLKGVFMGKIDWYYIS
jgi:hypothetical protein